MSDLFRKTISNINNMRIVICMHTIYLSAHQIFTLTLNTHCTQFLNSYILSGAVGSEDEEMLESTDLKLL